MFDHNDDAFGNNKCHDDDADDDHDYVDVVLYVFTALFVRALDLPEKD